MRLRPQQLIRKHKGREHTEDASVDEKIILQCILGKQGGRLTGFIWIRIGASGGPL